MLLRSTDNIEKRDDKHQNPRIHRTPRNILYQQCRVSMLDFAMRTTGRDEELCHPLLCKYTARCTVQVQVLYKQTADGRRATSSKDVYNGVLGSFLSPGSHLIKELCGERVSSYVAGQDVRHLMWSRQKSGNGTPIGPSIEFYCSKGWQANVRKPSAET